MGIVCRFCHFSACFAVSTAVLVFVAFLQRSQSSPSPQAALYQFPHDVSDSHRSKDAYSHPFSPPVERFVDSVPDHVRLSSPQFDGSEFLHALPQQSAHQRPALMRQPSLLEEAVLGREQQLPESYMERHPQLFEKPRARSAMNGQPSRLDSLSAHEMNRLHKDWQLSQSLPHRQLSQSLPHRQQLDSSTVSLLQSMEPMDLSFRLPEVESVDVFLTKIRAPREDPSYSQFQNLEDRHVSESQSSYHHRRLPAIDRTYQADRMGQTCQLDEIDPMEEPDIDHIDTAVLQHRSRETPVIEEVILVGRPLIAAVTDIGHLHPTDRVYGTPDNHDVSPKRKPSLVVARQPHDDRQLFVADLMDDTFQKRKHLSAGLPFAAEHRSRSDQCVSDDEMVKDAPKKRKRLPQDSDLSRTSPPERPRKVEQLEEELKDVDQSTPKDKHLKTARACQSCYKAKAACDSARPCGRCARLSKPGCVDRILQPKKSMSCVFFFLLCHCNVSHQSVVTVVVRVVTSVVGTVR
jgi:hypothetical protein